MKTFPFTVSRNDKPYIVAEMSGNHNHSLERALAIVEAAAQAGAHALKIQTYTADTITLNTDTPDFFISDEKSLWQGQSLHKLYQQAYTPWEWHKPIFDKCQELGIIGFSTPFDETAVDFLEELKVPIYKVASFENNHIPLIRKIAKTGKPIIMSVGMASIGEISDAVSAIRAIGDNQLVLLRCTSAYPASPADANLATLPHMRELFGCEVGLSDHTTGIGVAVASVAYGATLIEKHFTLSRADGGVDAAFSLEPAEFKALVDSVDQAWQARGKVSYGTSKNEIDSMKFRRSLYISQDMKKGEVFQYGQNIRIVRPGYGLSPREIDQFEGRKASRDVKAGTRVTWDLLG